MTPPPTTPPFQLSVVLNGEPRSMAVDPRMLLVEALREGFGLAGPKIGCATGDCGACTVRLDGRIVKSCLELVQAAAGSEITTIEGMADGDRLSAVQQAFCDRYGFQCGFCLSGMLFAAEDLLGANPCPSDEEIRDAIRGNLCRCTGYQNVVEAIREAGAGRRAAASSED
ncbi:(2Fe-2S)-binding protein [Pseudonocardia acidicola]|uniref:(2Fe-2S)-binding protein n=1 Tax=Pseudonocardia acidicola TaxID=2724939 RepID=A0ABX1SDK6_9PSEU|nr:(2Fe-2S)-binding protein [Pseudonocardia acidicola]NMH99654.1 (2Fe-2S)-binding protein [Pseudonocardia acidicola]